MDSMIRPIKKILIANRGEIAMRIIRAARELGIATAAIYSYDDKESLWVEQSSEAWPLGEGPLSETYLNIDKIITIALQSGSNAVHPGYGFLSENFLLAEACKKNNVTYIGPSAEVIKITGDKLSSRTIAAKLGIQVPGVLKGRPAEILVAVDNITYPVMVKAVMGGGGKGMRLAEDPYQLRDALKTTASEALQYFADKRVYVEQYIPDARHIEVQILGDQHGNIVHLFERECSVQRRHQKVIEEAPSEVMTEKNRALIIEAALKIAKEIKFTNAGTIEFLVDNKSTIYFLEVNPRLQVEHGVTEMITGIDIVKEQIQIAEGKPLTSELMNCRISGHAIEARIYAEDPENELLPSPGLIYHFIPPKIEGLRIETAVGNFTLLTSQFDPLMAKILVHAGTRQQAIQILQNAVRDFVITGISHNLTMLNAILIDPDYNLNQLSTQYLDNKIPEFSAAISLKRNDMITPVIAAALVTFFGFKDNKNDSPWIQEYWRNVRQLRFRQGYEIIELDYIIAGTSADFYIGEIEYAVRDVVAKDSEISFSINNERKDFYFFPDGEGNHIISDGHLSYVIESLSPRKQDRFISEGQPLSGTGDTVFSPQPGTVLEIKVFEGQEVNIGDNLLTIESMKLENTILAYKSGFIKKINIKTGDKVKKDEPLIYLQKSSIN